MQIGIENELIRLNDTPIVPREKTFVFQTKWKICFYSLLTKYGGSIYKNLKLYSMGDTVI